MTKRIGMPVPYFGPQQFTPEELGMEPFKISEEAIREFEKIERCMVRSPYDPRLRNFRLD